MDGQQTLMSGIESMQKKPFFFIVVVWGDAYVDMFLQVSLRCFLSPKNIPGLSNLETSKFVIVSTKKDYDKISQAAIFKDLEKYIEPIFLELDMTGEETVYTRATMGYEQATQVACQNKAYAIYLLPDCVISDGTFRRLERYAYEGRDVVLLPGPRLIKEKIMSYLEKNFSRDSMLALEPRKLAALGLEFFHPEFKNYNYTDQGFTKWPHMVSWNIPGQQGILVRAFHLHPLMVNYSEHSGPVDFNKFDTIDGSFIKRNFLNFNKFLLETDSDNMILYSMTDAEDRIEDGLLWGAKEKLQAILKISQLETMVNELQKIYFYNAYKLHVNDLNSDWLNMERESHTLVSAVFKYTDSDKNTSSLYSSGRKWLLSLLPSQLQHIVRKTYWKTQGAHSWFKAKLTNKIKEMSWEKRT